MADSKMRDQTIFEDILSSQKYITETYNTFTNECTTPAIRDEFLNLLNEEHKIQADVFDEMKTRGWYSPAAAEKNKIEQIRQKYKNEKN